jgi:hypothetical protein
MFLIALCFLFIQLYSTNSQVKEEIILYKNGHANHFYQQRKKLQFRKTLFFIIETHFNHKYQLKYHKDTASSMLKYWY